MMRATAGHGRLASVDVVTGKGSGRAVTLNRAARLTFIEDVASTAGLQAAPVRRSPLS